MPINPSRIFSTLGDMEQLLVEVEAEARGVSVEQVVVELIREGLAEDMDAVSQAGDRQWKSH